MEKETNSMRNPMTLRDVDIKAEGRSKTATRSILNFLLCLLISFLGWSFWSRPDGITASSRAGLFINQKGDHVQVGFMAAEKIDMDAFDWGTITPSKELRWTRCYEQYLCARLLVPLDYGDPKAGDAFIAIMKLPAKTAGTKLYRGPVLFNPGKFSLLFRGPGGSGINMIFRTGQQFRDILGDDFDIVGFDPRGTGFTEPGIDVFSSDSEREAWFMQDDVSLNTTVSSLGNAYARSQVLGELLHKMPDVNTAAAYVTTPLVARDMLSIVNAHGRDKLLYWGFSYGTILGATFAAMFPDKIERLIIDGVVDAENYYATLWSNNLRDTDAELMDIYEACVAAGPSACPIHEETAPLVKERVDSLLEFLKLNPIAVVDPQTSKYGIVDGGDVKMAIFRALYRPVSMARNLTIALAEAEKGNGLPILNLLTSPTMPLSCNCKPRLSVPFVDGGWTPSVAISCSDGDNVPADLDSLRSFYSDLAESSTFAENWNARLLCSGWHVQGKEKIDKGSIFANETSHPILLIGNTRDPVTPLWNAHKMSKAFGGSVVLTQNSLGHCSLSAVSLCSAKYIHKYFIEGTLPPVGTVCETESSIFGDDLVFDYENLAAEDQALLQASKALEKASFPHISGSIRAPLSPFGF